MGYAILDNGNASGNNKGYIYVFGIFLVFLIAGLVGFLPMLIYVSFLADPDALKAGYLDTTLLNETSEIIEDKNLEVVLTMFSSIFFILVLYWYVPRVHRRPFKTLYTVHTRIKWNQFFFSLSLFLFSILLLEGINYLRFPDTYSLHFNLKGLLGMFVIASSLVLLGQFGEIILIRSYVFQLLSKYFSKGIYLVIFGIILTTTMYFISNYEKSSYFFDRFVIFLSLYLITNILFLLSNSVELSWGLLMGYNYYTMIFVNNARTINSVNGLFQFEGKHYDMIYLILFFIILVLNFIILSRKFKLLPLSTLLSSTRFIQSTDK